MNMLKPKREPRIEVRRLSTRVWEVWSEASDSIYTVWFDPVKKEMFCTCMAGRTHGLKGGRCKHISAVLRHLYMETLKKKCHSFVPG